MLHRRVLEALAIRPRARSRTRRSSRTTRRPPATRVPRCEYATAAGDAGGLAGSAPRGRRAVRARPALRRQPEPGRARPSCSSATRTSATSRIRSTRRSRRSERALECYRELGDRRSEARGAVRAVGDALVPRPDRRVRARGPRGGGRARGPGAGTRAGARLPQPRGARRRRRDRDRLGDPCARRSPSGSATSEIALRARIEIDIVRYAERRQAGEARRGSRRRSSSPLRSDSRCEAGATWSGLALGRAARIAPMPTSIATSRPGSPTAASTISRSTSATCTPTGRARRSIAARWAEAADAAMIVAARSRARPIDPLLSALVVLGLARARQGEPGSSGAARARRARSPSGRAGSACARPGGRRARRGWRGWRAGARRSPG